MNNISSLFDKKKRELSNTSNDGQDTKKHCEASSSELSFEKASDGDVFKDSLKSENCMENIGKTMEELCIATKNTKESQIKGELQLVTMNKTINFISENFDEFEKDRHEKDEIIKNWSLAQSIDKLENSID